MSRPLGYARIIDPARAHPVETDTATCFHCDRIVHMHHADGSRKQGVLVHCHLCDRQICVPCAEQPRCTPLEKRLEAMEARGRLLAAAGIG